MSEMKHMTPLKKGQPREEDRCIWVCGLRPHTHILPFLLPEGSFFCACINEIDSDSFSLYSLVGVKSCALNAWQRIAVSRHPSSRNVAHP
jgi:hypothetical protein